MVWCVLDSQEIGPPKLVAYCWDLAAFRKLIQMPSVNQKLQLMGISDVEAEGFFDIMDGERQGGITIHQCLGTKVSSK